jgi:hypothetical protein
MPHDHDDDRLDGCELDFTVDPTADADVDGIVLFADIDPGDQAAVVARIAEYEAVFGDA